jgi:transposase-like protein
MIDCKGSQFEKIIIVWGVRWSVAFPIRDRQLEEMMSEQGGNNRMPTTRYRMRRNESTDNMRQSRTRRWCPGSEGTLYRCFLDRGGFGRSPPVARPRAK